MSWCNSGRDIEMSQHSAVLSSLLGVHRHIAMMNIWQQLQKRVPQIEIGDIWAHLGVMYDLDALVSHINRSGIHG